MNHAKRKYESRYQKRKKRKQKGKGRKKGNLLDHSLLLQCRANKLDFISIQRKKKHENEKFRIAKSNKCY